MASKETKVEKTIRLKQEFEIDSKNWNSRLVNVITFYSMINGFCLTEERNTEWSPDVDEPHFVLCPDPDVLGYDTYFRIRVVPLSDDDLDAMDEAERPIDMYHAQIAEEERKHKIMIGALAKLNDEEKKLLGL